MYGDLATFADVQDWLLTTPTQGLPPDEFPLIQRLITNASGFIHSWLNRFIPLADYEDIRDGTNGQELMFGNFPVRSVSSVTIDNIDVPPCATTITPGYSFEEVRLVLRAYRFSRGLQNVVIRYTAGYAPIPGEINQACIELVAQRYRERSRVGVKQETIVGVDSYTYNNPDLLPSIATSLQQYRKVTSSVAWSRRLAPTQTDPGVIVGAL
jgi:hypothetical protein